MSIGSEIDEALKRYSSASTIIKNIQDEEGLIARVVSEAFYDVLRRKLILPDRCQVKTNKYTIKYNTTNIVFLLNKSHEAEREVSVFSKLTSIWKKAKKEDRIAVKVGFDSVLYEKDLRNPYSFSGDPILIKEIKETYPEILLEIIKNETVKKEKVADFMSATVEIENL